MFGKGFDVGAHNDTADKFQKWEESLFGKLRKESSPAEEKDRNSLYDFKAGAPKSNFKKTAAYKRLSSGQYGNKPMSKSTYAKELENRTTSTKGKPLTVDTKLRNKAEAGRIRKSLKPLKAKR